MTMNGAALRRIRRRLKYTQVELAEKLGTTANTVARWERDEVRITEPMERLVRHQEASMANVTEDDVQAATQALSEYFALPKDGLGRDVLQAAYRKARRANAVVAAYARAREKEVAQLKLELRFKQALVLEVRELRKLQVSRKGGRS